MFLTPQSLAKVLRERKVSQAGLNRAVSRLAEPDPAGIVSRQTRAQVGLVAAYMHRGAVQDPLWLLLERGHPAARAIYWHELQELEGYRLLDIGDPLAVVEDALAYWQAHARASWEEARYWEAWAQAEGEDIPAGAFLLTHPLRLPQGEVDPIVDLLSEVWHVDVPETPVLRLRQAERFYRDKELARQAIERWLRR